MSDSPTFSTVSGKWVILVMLGLGVLAAAFALYYRHSFTRLALDYWGGREANAITTAPTVTLFELEAADGGEGGDSDSNADAKGQETFAWLEREFHPVRQIDLSKAGGLVHAREALVRDKNYQWNLKHQKPVASDRVWLLRFEGRNDVAALVFIDLERCFVGNRREPEVLMMDEKFRDGLERFIEEKANSE